MTIHTTGFFRETAHFDWLSREGVAHLAGTGAGRERPLVVWSAACSTGQEAYSCAMTLASVAGPAGPLSYRLIGTDLSRRVLARATLGIYSREEIGDIPEAMRRRFLLRGRRGEADRFRIVPELRARTEWRYCNLAAAGPGMPRGVDLVFLRNVLIYFDPPTRARVVAAAIDCLRPGGVILSGHSEPLRDPAGRLRALAPSIYLKEPSQ
jgi:chemotaxis protein methyltransferase CheR